MLWSESVRKTAPTFPCDYHNPQGERCDQHATLSLPASATIEDDERAWFCDFHAGFVIGKAIDEIDKGGVA